MTSPCKKIQKKEDPLNVFYKKDTLYEITINPCDKYQFAGDPYRVNKCVQFMSQLMNPLKELSEYSMVPELSESRFGNIERKGSIGSRFHYHGTIKFKDSLSIGKFLCWSIRQLQQRADIQLNEHRPEYWPKYLTKQKEIMKNLVKEANAPYIIKSSNPPYSFSPGTVLKF